MADSYRRARFALWGISVPGFSRVPTVDGVLWWRYRFSRGLIPSSRVRFRGPSRGTLVSVLPCICGGSGPSRGFVFQLQMPWMVRFRSPSRGVFVLGLPCNSGRSGPSRGFVFQLQISWMVCRSLEFRWSLSPSGCTVFSLDIQ